MNNNEHSGNSFFAFLVGGAIGAVVGLLYAPRPGRETREILVGEGDEMLNKALSSIRMAQEKALATIQSAQTRMESLNEEAKDRIQKLEEIAKDTLSEQKESVKKGYSKAKEVVQGANEDNTTHDV